ncbi:MAG: arylesterase [Pseudomonadota bacterium]
MRIEATGTMIWLCASLILAAASVLAVPTTAFGQEAKPIRVVALGDSLTAGYGLATNEAFPVQLEAALEGVGVPARVENAGVSGDTTTGGLARLDWSLGSENPDLVIVALGGNDFLRGIPVERTRGNMEEIGASLQAKQVPTLIAGMLAPPSMGAEYEQAFNAIYPAVAEQADAFLYPFFLEGVAFERDLNQPDGIHPTAEGIGVMVENMLPTIVQSLIETGACGSPADSICGEAAFNIAS